MRVQKYVNGSFCCVLGGCIAGVEQFATTAGPPQHFGVEPKLFFVSHLADRHPATSVPAVWNSVVRKVTPNSRNGRTLNINSCNNNNNNNNKIVCLEHVLILRPTSSVWHVYDQLQSVYHFSRCSPLVTSGHFYLSTNIDKCTATEVRKIIR